MRSHEKSDETNRAWLWCALACLTMALWLAGCSRQSAPTNPSAPHSEPPGLLSARPDLCLMDDAFERRAGVEWLEALEKACFHLGRM